MNTQNNIDSILNNIENSNARTIETLQAVKLDWQVKKVQLCTPDGTPVDYYANQRSDNGTVLHVVRDTYQVFQNEELVELCEAMAQTFDYKIHKGGSLDEGRKVYIQLESGSVSGIGENNDKIDRYMTALNSHDGSASVTFGAYGLTISCQNSFFRAARAEGMSKIRHTSNMQQRIEAAKRQIEAIQAEENKLYKTFFNMAEIHADQKHVNEIVRQLTEVDLTQSIEANREKHSTRKVNIAESLLKSIRNEMSYKGETLWGLMSGVTHFTTHSMSAPKRDNGRMESKLVGSALGVDSAAFQYLETFTL